MAKNVEEIRLRSRFRSGGRVKKLSYPFGSRLTTGKRVGNPTLVRVRSRQSNDIWDSAAFNMIGIGAWHSYHSNLRWKLSSEFAHLVGHSFTQNLSSEICGSPHARPIVLHCLWEPSISLFSKKFRRKSLVNFNGCRQKRDKHSVPAGIHNWMESWPYIADNLQVF